MPRAKAPSPLSLSREPRDRCVLDDRYRHKISVCLGLTDMKSKEKLTHCLAVVKELVDNYGNVRSGLNKQSVKTTPANVVAALEIIQKKVTNTPSSIASVLREIANLDDVTTDLLHASSHSIPAFLEALKRRIAELSDRGKVRSSQEHLKFVGRYIAFLFDQFAVADLKKNRAKRREFAYWVFEIGGGSPVDKRHLSRLDKYLDAERI